MPVVMGLLEYWSENPPVHVLEAAKAGIGRKKKPKVDDESMKPPRELTEAELIEEAKLPAWVQEIRKQQREERIKAWQEKTK